MSIGSQNVTDLTNLGKVTKRPRVLSLFKHVTFSANPCDVHFGADVPKKTAPMLTGVGWAKVTPLVQRAF